MLARKDCVQQGSTFEHWKRVDWKEYASVVTGYISTCIDNIVPIKCCKTIRIDPSEKPKDSTNWSWRNTTPPWIPGAFGRACSTPQTTSSGARESQPVKAHCEMSWLSSMLASMPSTPAEGLYQHRQHRALHSRWHQLRCAGCWEERTPGMQQALITSRAVH